MLLMMIVKNIRPQEEVCYPTEMGSVAMALKYSSLVIVDLKACRDLVSWCLPRITSVTSPTKTRSVIPLTSDEFTSMVFARWRMIVKISDISRATGEVGVRPDVDYKVGGRRLDSLKTKSEV